jgi:hypothetical protein
MLIIIDSVWELNDLNSELVEIAKKIWFLMLIHPHALIDFSNSKEKKTRFAQNLIQYCES